MTEFSPVLQSKIDAISIKGKPTQMGALRFQNPLILAPMSAICNLPFRLLMQELGAGATVSELISCHGINYGNEKTLKMLKLHPREKNIGLQIFGEDTQAMARAAATCQEYGPDFIDINMGCPVRKVVTKGGGSALLKDTSKLSSFFKNIRKELSIPLTIKIRTGWDEEQLNAREIINIAAGEGIEFVAIHGRTRTQQYKGKANWQYLESLSDTSKLPLIGNGDLNTPEKVRERLASTTMDALMIGRGALRNPFIFLESQLAPSIFPHFSPADYWQVIERYYTYLSEFTERERTILVQLRKHIVWMASGFEGAATFRNLIFQTTAISDTLEVTRDYFLKLDQL
ncbi:MAG: transcriptional regulator, partial [Halobacteriovoraceae bacterium]|nr:transcriptional regulator [Halobacteriovoraceae bacterium]